ncbi:MAG: type I pullulanase [Roseburia sp.]|nr:type I pullulanase [Roseburia sp.]
MEAIEKNKLGAWYSSEEFEKLYTYLDGDLGAGWTKNKTTFRVWAPTAKEVYVNLYQNGWRGKKETAERIAMDPHRNGVWTAAKNGDLQGTFYTYSVLIDGAEQEACDPYAKAVGVNGERAMVVDLASTNPEGWDKDKSPFRECDATDAVIYEAHIRDLTVHKDSGIENKGKFLGLTEEGTVNCSGDITGLDYIADLGVTHIHLLPFFDYASVDETQEGQYNWGYDPKNFFVPEGSYATDPYHGETRICEAKKMIAAFHSKGIGVIMDVVFNHVHDAEKFCFNNIVPGYFSRIDSEGVYSNGSICGNDTASERSMVREYIVQNILYWVEEYHMDGFRFDLVGLLDIVTVNEIIERVHEVRPEVLFYGEGWAMPTNVTKEVKMATQKNSHLTPGFAYFNDTIRNLLRGRNSDTNEKGYVNGRTGMADSLKSNLMGIPYWVSSPLQVVNYASCHDDLTLYDKLKEAEPEADRAGLLRSNRLAAGIVFAAAGIPFIQAGEELVRRKVNADGTMNSNSYNAGDSINAISWECLQNADCREMRDYYKGLIAFRKEHPSLRMGDIEEIRDRFTFYDIPKGEETVCLINCEGINGESAAQLCMIFNPEQAEKEIFLPDGRWEIHVSAGKAGTECIEEVKGSVTVSPVSCMFLVKKQESAYEENS